MNLKSLTDQALLTRTKELVSEERRLLTQILHHLREIENRRLFSTLGCSSLFTYCTEVLKYSESQAQRRISAMRLMKELPQIEEKISSGALSLTNLAQAQSFFKQEFSRSLNKSTKMQRTDMGCDKADGLNKMDSIHLNDDPCKTKAFKKLSVLEQLENTSSRQGQKVLLALSSNPEKTFLERERPISSELTEIRFAANEVLLAKMKRLKGLLSHTYPNMTNSDLFTFLCDLGLKTLDPIEKVQSKSESKSKRIDRSRSSKAIGGEPTPSPSAPKVNKRQYIGKSTRMTVWMKAGGRCEICKSGYFLEMDHIQPVSLGGGNSLNNLRLLCRNCNLREAIEKLGSSIMGRYLFKPKHNDT